MTRDLLTFEQIAAEQLADWSAVGDQLAARYALPEYSAGLHAVAAIGAAAEAADHHPDLVLRYGVLEVVLSSHDAGGVTTRDVDLARTISAVASDLGLTPGP